MLKDIQYNSIEKYLIKVAEGGEAKTYFINQTIYQGYIAKIFKQDDKSRVDKIEAMIKATYDKHILEYFAWPLARIMYGQKFVGYLMRYVKADPLSKIQSPLTSKRCSFKVNPRNLVKLSKNLFLALHIFKLNFPGSIFSDISSHNILVQSDGRPFFIDVDSIEYYDRNNKVRHIAKYFTEGYRSYEAIAGQSLNETSDCFALAIIVFQLLMNGKHPFAIKSHTITGTTDFEQNILRGYNAYFNKSKDYTVPDGSYKIDEIMNQQLYDCFKQTFVTGLKEFLKRENAYSFYKALESLESEMKICRQGSGHYYLKRSCQFCHPNSKSLKNKNISRKVNKLRYNVSIKKVNNNKQQNSHAAAYSSSNYHPFYIAGYLSMLAYILYLLCQNFQGVDLLVLIVETAAIALIAFCVSYDSLPDERCILRAIIYLVLSFFIINLALNISIGTPMIAVVIIIASVWLITCL